MRKGCRQVFWPWRTEGLGRPHSITVLKGQLQRGQRISSQTATWRMQGAMGTSCTGRGLSWYKKNVLQWEESITGVHRDVVEFPITTGFQDATIQGTRQSHPGSFILQKVGCDVILRSPPTSAVLWFYVNIHWLCIKLAFIYYSLKIQIFFSIFQRYQYLHKILIWSVLCWKTFSIK